MRQHNRLVFKRITVCLLVLSLLAGGLATAAAAEPAVPEGAVLPEWYSFPEDALSLYNDSRSIGLQYYVDAYGPLKGRFLYDLFEANGSHGLCYGISFAGGAILAGDPAIGSFYAPDGSGYGSVNDLKKGSVSNTYGLTLSDIIKYAYVSQASAEVADNYLETKNDPEGLRAAVAAFVYHGGPPVAVGLLGTYASHEVLAVGLLGEEDVVISDSNDPSRLYVLDFTGNNWEYRCGGYTWRSGSADFDYCPDIISVIAHIKGEPIASDPFYTYNEAEENDAATEINISDYVCYDLDHMLLMVPDDFDYTPKEIASHVGFGESTYFDVNYDFDYLWADADGAVVTKNEAEDPRTLVLMGNREGIMSSVLPEHVAAVTASDDAPSLLLQGRDGEEAFFASFRLDENDELEFLLISGTFDGDEVFATTDDGQLYVSGLRSVAAVVETMGGRQSEMVTLAGGELLLSGDLTSGVELTLLGDADGDGRVTSSDARIALRCSVKLENVDDYDSLACDFDMDDSVTSADARLILRRSVGLRD